MTYTITARDFYNFKEQKFEIWYSFFKETDWGIEQAKTIMNHFRTIVEALEASLESKSLTPMQKAEISYSLQEYDKFYKYLRNEIIEAESNLKKEEENE